MSSERSRLELDPERMRELGYRTVDALVDWLGDDSQPLLRRAPPDEIAARLARPLTDAGEPFGEVLEGLFRDVLPFINLLRDGKWHADEELAAVTHFPQDWLAEVEREGFELEWAGESFRLVA